MGDAIGLGCLMVGFGFMVAAVTLMVRWLRSDSGRALLGVRDQAQASELTRDMYRQAWPLCAAAGLFFLALGPVVGGDRSPLRLLLLVAGAAATVGAAVAYRRLRA
jgi:hypothetical protein